MEWAMGTGSLYYNDCFFTTCLPNVRYQSYNNNNDNNYININNNNNNQTLIIQYLSLVNVDTVTWTRLVTTYPQHWQKYFFCYWRLLWRLVSLSASFGNNPVLKYTLLNNTMRRTRLTVITTILAEVFNPCDLYYQEQRNSNNNNNDNNSALGRKISTKSNDLRESTFLFQCLALIFNVLTPFFCERVLCVIRTSRLDF